MVKHTSLYEPWYCLLVLDTESVNEEILYSEGLVRGDTVRRGAVCHRLQVCVQVEEHRTCTKKRDYCKALMS